MSWIHTSQDSGYQEALAAVDSLGPPAVGFARPTEVAGPQSKSDTIIKQLNFLIEYQVRQGRRLEDIDLRLQKLEKQLTGAVAADPATKEVLAQLGA